jgi:hypothetical protein
MMDVGFVARRAYLGASVTASAFADRSGAAELGADPT